MMVLKMEVNRWQVKSDAMVFHFIIIQYLHFNYNFINTFYTTAIKLHIIYIKYFCTKFDTVLILIIINFNEKKLILSKWLTFYNG